MNRRWPGLVPLQPLLLRLGLLLLPVVLLAPACLGTGGFRVYSRDSRLGYPRPPEGQGAPYCDANQELRVETPGSDEAVAREIALDRAERAAGKRDACALEILRQAPSRSIDGKIGFSIVFIPCFCRPAPRLGEGGR
jgi:hypothetical protein